MLSHDRVVFGPGQPKNDQVTTPRLPTSSSLGKACEAPCFMLVSRGVLVRPYSGGMSASCGVVGGSMMSLVISPESQRTFVDGHTLLGSRQPVTVSGQ